MGTRSQDAYPRGTRVRDKDGDTWRKGTAWWHWQQRSVETGPGKLLYPELDRRYGPLELIETPTKKENSK